MRHESRYVFDTNVIIWDDWLPGMDVKIRCLMAHKVNLGLGHKAFDVALG
jgi:hypothetical protein